MIDSMGNIIEEWDSKSEQKVVKPESVLESPTIKGAFQSTFGKKAKTVFSSYVWNGNRGSYF